MKIAFTGSEIVYKLAFMRFEVMIAVRMSVLFLWVVTHYRKIPFSFLKREAVCSFKTLVSVYKST
jgi:hypothetical protein